MEKDILQYTIVDEMLPGSQARVLLVKDIDGRPFVLKKIALEEGTKFTKHAIRESYLLYGLKHQNIVSMYDMFVHDGSFYMVLEYMATDLLEHISRNHKTMTPELIKYLKQILLATSYCHSLGIIHRDLKPANILLDTSREILKLADFGLARGLITASQALTPQVVTLDYRAPEIIMGSEHYTAAADIWSVGCIFAEMIRGKVLFGWGHRDCKTWGHFQLGKPQEENWCLVDSLSDFSLDGIPEPQGLGADFEHVNNAAIDLLLKLLTLNPKNRISAADALEHEYFATPNAKGVA